MTVLATSRSDAAVVFTTLPKELADFLGPRATSVVASIADAHLRKLTIEALDTCREALKAVDELDLVRYEFQGIGPPEPAVWYQLVPEIERIVRETWRAAQRLVALYPIQTSGSDESEVDVDGAFDAMVTDGPPAPIRDDREGDVDRLVTEGRGQRPDLPVSMAALAAMLKADFLTFQHRIGQFTPSSDRWWLLGDVQEFRSRCTNCLEAATAAILSSLSTEDLERLLPRYADATTRAIRLRTAFTDLESYVRNAAEWLAYGGDTRSMETASGLKRELDAFTRLPAYAYVRAADKRGILQFRLFVEGWERNDGSFEELRTELEGFRRLTELFRGINRRPALMASDRRYLKAIVATIELGLTVTDVLHFLKRVYGRFDPLDEVIRACNNGRQPMTESVVELSRQALEHLP